MRIATKTKITFKEIIPLFVVIVLCLILYICGPMINFETDTAADTAATKELNEKFIGKTFVGHETERGNHNDYYKKTVTDRTFEFINSETVRYTYRLERIRFDDYIEYNEKTEERPYSVKQTKSGEAYIFIQGFGSDGVDTSDNSKGMRIQLYPDGALRYFVWEYTLGSVTMEVTYAYELNP